jgi:acetoacetyl-CoA synthetase
MTWTPLRLICSTGSPLSPEELRVRLREIKADVQLASISGGTDIVSCFVLGVPDAARSTPARSRGRAWGMAVEVFNDAGSR